LSNPAEQTHNTAMPETTKQEQRCTACDCRVEMRKHGWIRLTRAVPTRLRHTGGLRVAEQSEYYCSEQHCSEHLLVREAKREAARDQRYRERAKARGAVEAQLSGRTESPAR
jgi:hypothetical protein